ncbi:MAG TPA: metallophosphoesterase [Ferruginibacter sp.]|nr:metallophosphoesterase [Ferruginibacter sp.]HRE64562.1 metallophosphoesterase [Ferruginibacter sp.]
MRKLLQYLLKKPLTWMANKLAASPRPDMVSSSLTQLYNRCVTLKGSDVELVDINASTARFIIFSDQHKGNKSWADDFNQSEPTYLAALNYYNKDGYSFINLGDSEELWKFKAADILPQNEKTFAAEAAFFPSRYFKTFGNHDIVWKDKFAVNFYLKKYFGVAPVVTEGIVLRDNSLAQPLDIFLTHGHQGDLMSDNNWISTWVVAHIWMPLQRYLRININSASSDFSLRNEHNKIMYAWSKEQQNLLLITGHTHSPVFASGKYLDHPSNKIDTPEQRTLVKPCYFNTGCCCFNDGDITGIEIADGFIRLIKWTNRGTNPARKILEEKDFKTLMNDMQAAL